jgi:drug/metabolite transporter (DMT)-like permease
VSDENGTPATPAGSLGPHPEPLRFFGTSWVNHDDGYPLRRIGAAVGSLVAAVASCLVLRFAYQGLQIADTGAFVTVLVVAMFAICSALAFRTTWDSFTRRPDPDRQASLRGLLAIGFVGSLLAYFFRSLT